MFFRPKNSSSVKLTAVEFNTLYTSLYNLKPKSSELNFLDEINILDIEFYWCLTMDSDNGVLGCFDMFQPNKIFLQNFNFPDTRDNINEILSVICHELHHYYLFQKCPWLYAICTLPVLRNYTIEVPAHRIEKIVDEILEDQILNKSI